jgi:hypothetical protein
MSYADYHAIAAVRWSHLKHMDRSPLHYLHATTQERPDTPALRFGRAVHVLTLEPEQWGARYVVWDGGARRGKAWESFEGDNADREILTADEAERVRAIAGAVRRHPVAGPMLAVGATEGVIQWADEETGVACKGRFDHVHGRLVDLKTAADVDPRRWMANAYRYGYHAQLAFYADGLRASGVDLRDADPAIICVESVPPHDVLVYTLDPIIIDQGRQMYRRLLARVKECTERGEWPGISGASTLPLVLPAWAEAEGDEHGDIGDLGLVAAE